MRPLPERPGNTPTLLVGEERAGALKAQAANLTSITLGQRQLCDLELLLNGAFHPLRGFMGEAAYVSVLERLRLPEGQVWPMPVTLDVDRSLADALQPGTPVALRDREGFITILLNFKANSSAEN